MVVGVWHWVYHIISEKHLDIFPGKSGFLDTQIFDKPILDQDKVEMHVNAISKNWYKYAWINIEDPENHIVVKLLDIIWSVVSNIFFS